VTEHVHLFCKTSNKHKLNWWMLLNLDNVAQSSKITGYACKQICTHTTHYTHRWLLSASSVRHNKIHTQDNLELPST